MACYWLARRGYDVLALAFPADVIGTRLAVEEIRFTSRFQFGFLNRWRYFYIFLRLLVVRFRHAASAVYYVQGTPNSLPALFALAFVPRERVIFHCQDLPDPIDAPFWSRIEGIFARRAGYVVWNDESRAQFVKAYHRLREKPLVVPTLLPAWWSVPAYSDDGRRALCAKFSMSFKERFVLFAGGPYSENRCSETLLEALTRLPPYFVLLFSNTRVASNEARLLATAVAKRGLSDRVASLPPLPFSDLLAVTACCDCGVLLYRDKDMGSYFQSPGRLSEYLRCGIPILASDFPNFRLLVLNHPVGEVARPSDAESVANAVLRIRSRFPGTQASREGLTRLALAEFVYDRFAPRLEEVVLNAVSLR